MSRAIPLVPPIRLCGESRLAEVQKAELRILTQ